MARLSDTPCRLERLDLSARPDTEREAELQRLLREETRCPFDLAAGPLLRARLLQLGASSHILQVVLHHIIADGWSLGLFIREWPVLYTAALRGCRQRRHRIFLPRNRTHPCRRCPSNTRISPTGKGNGSSGSGSNDSSPTGDNSLPVCPPDSNCPLTFPVPCARATAGPASPFHLQMN